jgi:tRNA(Ile)-lysidine synthase
LAATAFPGRVHALSFDHGLRAESAAECAMVARLAAAKGVPHATLRPDVALGTANIQAEARAARYAAMAGWCIARAVPVLLTAHHADDQAETLLMRLLRGSGVSGLAGIRAATDIAGVRVLRPLLGWNRSELRAVLEGTGWVPADDPGNANPQFDRVRVRALLAREPMLDAGRLAASAAHLADAEAALAWATDLAWASRASVSAQGIALEPEALPPELQRRLLARGLAALGVVDPDGPALAQLAERLAAGGTGTLGGVHARWRGHRWLLGPAPPRSNPA